FSSGVPPLPSCATCLVCVRLSRPLLPIPWPSFHSTSTHPWDPPGTSMCPTFHESKNSMHRLCGCRYTFWRRRAGMLRALRIFLLRQLAVVVGIASGKMRTEPRIALCILLRDVALAARQIIERRRRTGARSGSTAGRASRGRRAHGMRGGGCAVRWRLRKLGRGVRCRSLLRVVVVRTTGRAKGTCQHQRCSGKFVVHSILLCGRGCRVVRPPVQASDVPCDCPPHGTPDAPARR